MTDGPGIIRKKRPEIEIVGNRKDKTAAFLNDLAECSSSGKSPGVNPYANKGVITSCTIEYAGNYSRSVFQTIADVTVASLEAAAVGGGLGVIATDMGLSPLSTKATIAVGSFGFSLAGALYENAFSLAGEHDEYTITVTGWYDEAWYYPEGTRRIAYQTTYHVIDISSSIMEAYILSTEVQETYVGRN